MSKHTGATHPLIAAALVTGVVVAAFALNHPLAPLPLLAAVIVAAALTRTLRALARATVFIVLPMVVMIFVVQGPFYPGGTHVLARFGPARVTTEGILVAWQLASRLSVATMALMVFGLWVSPTDLLATLRRCRVPPRLAYLWTAPLSLVGDMSRRLVAIRDAMRSRGVDDAGVRGLVRRLRTHPIPLLTGIVLGATERADVLAGRGFLRPPRPVTAPSRPADLTGVCFTYPDGLRALDGIDLVLEPKSCTVILGAENSGRTTLARLIAGLLATEGTTTGGIALSAAPLGYVGATPSAQVTGMSRTVAGELAFGLTDTGPTDRSNGRVEEIVRAHAATLGLTPLLSRDPMSLSGGERQLVGIASAALCATSARGGAPALILDEPYASLDQPTADRVVAMLETLRASGLALVITDSRVRPWMAGADQVVVLSRGRVALRGAPDQVLGDPGLRTAGVRPTRTWEVARELLPGRDRLPWRPDHLARELA